MFSIMYYCKKLKSIVFGVSIVIISLMFILPIDSDASVRWETKFFSSFGLSMGYKSIKHQDDLIDAIYDSEVTDEGSAVALTGKAGKALSQTTAVYLPVSFTSLGVNYFGVGMMLRPSTDSTFFFFGDVGVVPVGGPIGLSAGVGYDFSNFTIDVSALVAGGGNGQTIAAMVSLSYLWSQ